MLADLEVTPPVFDMFVDERQLSLGIRRTDCLHQEMFATGTAVRVCDSASEQRRDGFMALRADLLQCAPMHWTSGYAPMLEQHGVESDVHARLAIPQRRRENTV